MSNRNSPLANAIIHTPFERTYWVRPGLMLAGLYPSSPDGTTARSKLSALLATGIQAVVNLMEPDETNYQGQPFAPYEAILQELASHRATSLSLLRHPIRDMSIPSRSTMGRILDSIDLCLGKGQPVYVHCWGGRGRTGTVVGCHLIRHGLADQSDVLQVIDRLRSRGNGMVGDSPETNEQRRMVLSWQRGE